MMPPMFRHKLPADPEPPVYAEDLRNISLTLLDILEEVQGIRGLLREEDDGEEEADDEP